MDASTSTMQMVFGSALTMVPFVSVIVPNGGTFHGTGFSLLFSKVSKFFFFFIKASEVSSNVEHETMLYSHHRPCD